MAGISDGLYKIVSTNPTTTVMLANGRVERVYFYKVISTLRLSEKIRNKVMKREGAIREEHPTDEQAKGRNPVENTLHIPQEYVVQRIVDHDEARKGIKYRIRWYR